MEMKRVLITGGPTNEYIDAVMKITNMSSGKVAIELAEHFIAGGYEVTLLLTSNIKHPILDKLSKHPSFILVRFETTEELENSIAEYSVLLDYDIVIHSAAVADYKPAYSFRLEDMAKEIAQKISENSFDKSAEQMEKDILSIMSNPDCKVNDNTKISSVEPHLTVKLGLTPKIIASLRKLFPNAFICGFKLLENVAEEELVDAAVAQVNKCRTNLCFANDLAELRKGNSARLVVSASGYKGIKVEGAYGIYNLIRIATS